MKNHIFIVDGRHHWFPGKLWQTRINLIFLNSAIVVRRRIVMTTIKILLSFVVVVGFATVFTIEVSFVVTVAMTLVATA